MTTTWQSTTYVRLGATHRLPEPDNSISAEPRSLAQAVHATARSVEENTLRAAGQFADGPAIQPKMLLALLSCCYAHQIYGSVEIAERLQRDSDLRLTGQSELPGAQVICRFRRENREPLLRCLQAALRFQVEQKMAQGIVTRVNDAQLAEEARRRIIMATFVDSMEMATEQTTDAPVDLCYLFAKRDGRAH